MLKLSCREFMRGQHSKKLNSFYYRNYAFISFLKAIEKDHQVQIKDVRLRDIIEEMESCSFFSAGQNSPLSLVSYKRNIQAAIAFQDHPETFALAHELNNDSRRKITVKHVHHACYRNLN